MYDELSKCYKVHFIGIIVKGQRYTISRDVRHIVIVVATSTSIIDNKPDENNNIDKGLHKLGPLGGHSYAIVFVVQNDKVTFEYRFTQNYVSGIQGSLYVESYLMLL